MKKFLLTMFMAITTIVAMAQTNIYTDMLNVIMEGEPAGSQTATIYVEENTDGTYKLSLNNFVLGSGEEALAVGNIVVDNIETTEVDGVKTFQTSQDILITKGDASQDFWMGPFLEEVSISLTGKMDNEKLTCTIAIDALDVNVVFGNTIKYTDMLLVIMEGEPMGSQTATIYVEENTNGTYKLSLNNFVLGSGDEALAVGNIVVDNIKTTEVDGVKTFQISQDILITEGDASQDFWMGPFLEEVSINLTGKMDDKNLFCTIAIDALDVNVVFGDENAVTSIENIAVENGENVIYDITGRKVKEITNAGIYIVNGKKVFVK